MVAEILCLVINFTYLGALWSTEMTPLEQIRQLAWILTMYSCQIASLLTMGQLAELTLTWLNHNVSF